MVKVALIILSILFFVSILGSGCGLSVYTVGKDILNNRFQISKSSFSRFASKFQIFRWCTGGLPIVDKLPELLNNKTYIVLLQNNTELRPSGGFMGSYVRLKAQGSGIKEIEVQDIYVPDGQLVGHVDPPAPIQEAFKQGWWKLRDSNWDPDFTIAAQQIAWFFEQGGEQVDGMIAVNLGLVQKILNIVGPIKLDDYPEEITSKNIWTTAQKYAEVNFFPGSTQKGDFLSSIGKTLLGELKNIKFSKLLRLLLLVQNEFRKNQILVWLPGILESGGLGFYLQDYLYIVESNLGANKANCCVTREITQDVTVNSNSNWDTKLTITYKNSNDFPDPKPPVFWGGDYHNYLRIIIPSLSQIKDEQKYSIEQRGKFKIVGWWVKVPAGQTVQTELNYTVVCPSCDPDRYQVLVKRQPGIEVLPYKLILNGKLKIDAQLDKDQEFVVSSKQ